MGRGTFRGVSDPLKSVGVWGLLKRVRRAKTGEQILTI